jgi:hypothetical protein
MAAIAAAGFVVLALAIYKTYSYFSKPSRLSVVPRVRGAHWLLGHARKEAVDGHDATHEGWAAEYGHVYTYGGILNVRLDVASSGTTHYGSRSARI